MAFYISDQKDTMETYLQNDMIDHQHPTPFKIYDRIDKGKFDICRDCVLKQAVLALFKDAA